MHPHCWDDSGGRRRPLFLSDIPLRWKERWMEERKRRRQETERGLGCGADPWPTLTRRHPPQPGLLSVDRALYDLLHVKSNPLESPLPPRTHSNVTRSGFKHCQGPGGSQIELGSSIMHMFFCVNVCVCLDMWICVYMLVCAVVKNLWSCNLIRGWVEKNGSPRVLEWLN